jgi:hypothetical protein
MDPLTYREAGVDLEAGDEAVRRIAPLARMGVNDVLVHGAEPLCFLDYVLPDGCRAVLRRRAWKVPPVFEALRRGGDVADAEMFRTFNMGIGLVLVTGGVGGPSAGRRAGRAGRDPLDHRRDRRRRPGRGARPVRVLAQGGPAGTTAVRKPGARGSPAE